MAQIVEPEPLSAISRTPALITAGEDSPRTTCCQRAAAGARGYCLTRKPSH